MRKYKRLRNAPQRVVGYLVPFEMSTSVKMRVVMFWIMTLCSLICRDMLSCFLRKKLLLPWRQKQVDLRNIFPIYQITRNLKAAYELNVSFTLRQPLNENRVPLCSPEMCSFQRIGKEMVITGVKQRATKYDGLVDQVCGVLAHRIEPGNFQKTQHKS